MAALDVRPIRAAPSVSGARRPVARATSPPAQNIELMFHPALSRVTRQTASGLGLTASSCTVSATVPALPGMVPGRRAGFRPPDRVVPQALETHQTDGSPEPAGRGWRSHLAPGSTGGCGTRVQMPPVYPQRGYLLASVGRYASCGDVYFEFRL